MAVLHVLRHFKMWILQIDETTFVSFMVNLTFTTIRTEKIDEWYRTTWKRIYTGLVEWTPNLLRYQIIMEKSNEPFISTFGPIVTSRKSKWLLFVFKFNLNFNHLSAYVSSKVTISPAKVYFANWFRWISQIVRRRQAFPSIPAICKASSILLKIWYWSRCMLLYFIINAFMQIQFKIKLNYWVVTTYLPALSVTTLSTKRVSRKIVKGIATATSPRTDFFPVSVTVISGIVNWLTMPQLGLAKRALRAAISFAQRSIYNADKTLLYSQVKIFEWVSRIKWWLCFEK